MANSYFCNETESVLRYRYCSFKARHSTGATKARWEDEARQARKEAISEKLQRETATQEYKYINRIGLPARYIDQPSFYQVDDQADFNLRVLGRKTIPEINEAIEYWENYLDRVDLGDLAKRVLRFQLRKLRSVKSIKYDV